MYRQPIVVTGVAHAKVVHRFRRIERTQGHFHKHRIPIAHSPIPQAGQLQSLEFFSVFTFIRNESRITVHIIGQIELVSFIILHCTNQIYGIEMRPFLNMATYSGFRVSI